MSYDEHLISMAGGDGDMLDQIQRRADQAAKWPVRNIADVDRSYLLALVLEQQAKLDAVEKLAEYWARTPALRRVSAASRLLVALAGTEVP